MPQPTTLKGKYSAAGEGNVYARANTATCKVTAADTDGSYEIFDEICKPGFESRLHMHVKSFQVCYVVDGSGEFQLGDEVFHAKKGACVNIPPGTPHKVGSKEGMRMLMVYSPPRPRGHDGGDEGADAGAAQGRRADRRKSWRSTTPSCWAKAKAARDRGACWGEGELRPDCRVIAQLSCPPGRRGTSPCTWDRTLARNSKPSDARHNGPRSDGGDDSRTCGRRTAQNKKYRCAIGSTSAGAQVSSSPSALTS